MKRVYAFVIALNIISCDKRETDKISSGSSSLEAYDTTLVDMQRLRSQILEKRKYLESFKSFGIGTGCTPQERSIHEALMFLLSSEAGSRVFDDMVESTNWATVLYGLVGVYYTRPSEYMNYVEKVRRRANGATVIIDEFTDVVSDFAVPVDKLLLNPDGYRLYYGETIPQHCWRKCLKFELEKHDFFGGSIPIAWLDIGTNYLITEGGYPGGDEMPNLINVDEGSLLIIDKKAEFYNMWSKHLNRAMKVKANPRANSSSER